MTCAAKPAVKCIDEPRREVDRPGDCLKLRKNQIARENRDFKLNDRDVGEA